MENKSTVPLNALIWLCGRWQKNQLDQKKMSGILDSKNKGKKIYQIRKKKKLQKPQKNKLMEKKNNKMQRQNFFGFYFLHIFEF